MAGDPLPFAPLTQALRRLDRTGTLNLQLERLPELARLVPGFAPAKTTRTADLAAASQLGLFQSVLDLVDRLGAAAPVLHIVEDVHWADRSTLDLVRFLATNLTNERAVLLVTLRADAVVPATPLALWVAELARLENAERVVLGRWTTTRPLVWCASWPVTPPIPSSSRPRSPDPRATPCSRSSSSCRPPRTRATRRLLPATLHELLHARVHALPEDTQSVLRALPPSSAGPPWCHCSPRRPGPSSSRPRRCSGRPSTSTWSRSAATTPSPSGTRRSARSSTRS